ncbi:MAG: 50S ribosomal protein L9 [Gammaproteobacteria bacterium]|nr:50S ribosomal protein L9 [Gammaproteobacteria bacterium]
MEVILLEKIANLGNIGDRVRVKPGFGRNFLLPRGKATVATVANIALFEARRADLEKKQADELAAAGERAAAAARLTISLTAKAGSEGKLFGSLGTADIAEACTAAGVEIRRSEIRLPNGPIRTVGKHSVDLHFHSDIDATIEITVIAEDVAGQGK